MDWEPWLEHGLVRPIDWGGREPSLERVRRAWDKVIAARSAYLTSDWPKTDEELRQAFMVGKDSLLMRQNLEPACDYDLELIQRLTRELCDERVVDSITDSLIIVDPSSHRIVQANDHFLSSMGVNAQEVLQKTCYEIIHGRHNPCETYGISCPVRDTALSDCPTMINRGYRDKDGTERLMQISAYPLHDSRGRVNRGTRRTCGTGCSSTNRSASSRPVPCGLSPSGSGNDRPSR